MRRYSLNVVFVLLTAVPLLLVAVGIHFLHAAQKTRSVDLFLKRSIEAQRDGNSADAIRYLQLYLPNAPRDAVSIERLGSLMLAQAQKPAQYMQSFLILERSLQVDPAQPVLRRQVAELAMRPELQRYSDAQAHLEWLLKVSPDNLELLDLLAQCHEKNRRYAEATDTLARLIALDPRQVAPYVALARLYRENLEDPTRADRVMDARDSANGLVTQNPESSQAFLERARYRRRYSLPGSEADIARARELAPDDPETLSASAELSVAKGQFQEARADLEKAVKARPQEARYHIMLSEVERQDNQPLKSSERLRNGLTTVADPLQASQLRWALADLLIDNGQLEEARQVLRQLDPAQTRKELIDYLEARLLFADNKWYAASQAFENLSLALRDIPALGYQADLQLAQCYDRLDNPDRGLAVYRRAIELDPAALPARLGLAASLVELGQRSEAIQAYRALVGQVPGLWILIARLQAAEVLDQPPDRRNWRQVDEALNEAAREQPGSLEVALLRAGLLANRGQVDQARESLATLAQQHPEDQAIRLALASLAAATTEPPRDEPEALKALDDSPDSRLVRIRFWADAGGSAAAPALTRLEQGLDALEPADRERLLQALASAYQKLGDDTSARTCFEKLATVRPDLLGYRLALYELALRSSDEPFLQSSRLAVRQSLDKQPASNLRSLVTVLDLAARDPDPAFQQIILTRLREFEGDQGPNWRLAQARQLLANARRHGTASLDPKVAADVARLLDQAAALRPSFAEVHALLGELAILRGDASSALTSLERAKALGFRSPSLFLNLYRLYADLGRLDQADNQVRELQRLGITNADPLFQKLVVEAEFRGDSDREKTLALARSAAPADSTDYRDHLWLSQVLEASGQPAEAEAALRRAAQLNPADPLPWVSLVRLLVRQNQLEAAREAFSQAARATPPDRRDLTLAQCAEALGDPEVASQHYDAALLMRPADPTLLRLVAAFALQNRQFDRAISSLKQLASLPSQTPQDQDWTRRTLAITLAASGESQERAEALQLLKIPLAFDQFLPAPSAPIEELQAQFQVLVLQPFSTARKAAIRILQDLVDRRNSGTPEDQFLLAQLYEADGQWPLARSRILKLLVSSPESPRFLVQYVSWLLDPSPYRGHFKPDEALPALNRLEKLAPQAFSTLALRARYLKAVNRSQEILPELAAFAVRDPQLLHRVAELYESLGRIDLAEAAYRRYIEQCQEQQKPAALFFLAQFLERHQQITQAERVFRQFVAAVKQPEAALDLAAFLSRTGRVAEALDLCEASWAACPPQKVSAATVSAVNRAPLDPALAARAETALRKALEITPSDPDLLLNLASLQILREAFDQAEATYRQILEPEPSHAGALQGLAWLIAARDPDRALEAQALVDRAIARQGEQPSLLDLRAFLQIRQQDAPGAIDSLQQALRASPAPDPLWLVHLSQAHLLAEAPELAAQALSQAREAGLDETAIPALEKPPYGQLLHELKLASPSS